jgi:hypothetical protein
VNHIGNPSQNNLFTKTMYPNQSSAAWRQTVSSLQEHCFAKLKLDLDGLSTDAEKLKLLTLAHKEMHIFPTQNKILSTVMRLAM